MSVKVLLVTLLLALNGSSTAQLLFAVLEAPWSECRAVNETNSCYRTRDVSCVRTSDNKTAPWYYCVDGDQDRPLSVEMCAQGSCVQDCVVTEWSEWTDCNCMEGFYRTRERLVVAPPQNGGAQCPSLLERQQCPSCFNNAPFDRRPRDHTWKTGAWRACVALDKTTECGSGLQNRTLQCVAFDGRIVSQSKCQEESAYTDLLAPPTTRLCTVPCDCKVGDWSSWSPCQAVCNTITPHTASRRTREITQQPTTGGADCPPLIDTNVCSNTPPTECPAYYWTSSDWTVCRYRGSAECGHGYTSQYLHCVKDLNGTIEYVDFGLCDQFAVSPRPSQVEHCYTECPQVCVVGEWSGWTECAPSCEQTYSNRSREILVTPQGEETCPHTVEMRACPVLPCVQWVPQPFADCYISSDQGCGAGEQSRNIVCGDVHGNTIDSFHCFRLPQPYSTQQDCYIPCPEDCVVSEWSPWSECTHKCGQDYGTQTRSRRLIVIGTNCPYNQSDFTETRTCTLPAACEPPSYHVEVGPWSECREGMIGSGDSSNLIQFNSVGTRTCEQGIRNRTSYCMLEGQIVSAEDCPIDFAVSETDSCDLSCDQECVFSAWSDYSSCSTTCGEGEMSRTRHLIQFPDDPQRVCGVDEYGREVETVVCGGGDCVERVYQWVADDWSDCALFTNGDTTPSCGYGYEATSLSCTDVGSGEQVSDNLCVDLPRPLTARPCVLPCPDRCILTEWSDFSPCENGQQSRSRDIIPFASSTSWTDSCSHLFSLPLQETVECEDFNIELYGYSTISFYSAPIIESPDPTAVCGNGFRYRSVACVNMFGDPNVYFDEEFCSHDQPDETVTQTTVKCDRDCVQSEWTDWTPCSTTCGYGTRTRTRTMLTRPLTGGRPCGVDTETDICYTQDCEYAQYTPGPFSICKVSNSSNICGYGNRTREPLCTVNGVLQETTTECELQGVEVTFDLSEACVMPCPGVCVVSDWGEWSECPKENCLPGVTCQQSRQRAVIRDGDNCPSTQEFQVCTPEDDPFAWSVSSWGDCTLSSAATEMTAGAYCGDGVQRGVVECVDMISGDITYDAQCTRPKPLDIQACTVPCPIDCVLGPFSEWSDCPQRCERGLKQYRNRSIVTQSAHGGRVCPEVLTEERSCPPTDCTVYVIEESREPSCEQDLTPPSQCGAGHASRALSCRRNTQFMELAMCLEAIEQGLNVIGGEFVTSEACSGDIDCPLEPVCTYTEWSDWSNCTSTCVDSNVRYSYRTRALISSHLDSTEECHSMQYEMRDCLEPDNSTDLIPFQSSSSCIGFQWISGEFTSDGTRTVQCRTDSGTIVSGGCSLQTMPSVTRPSCEPSKCPSYSECANDACECSGGFEAVTGQCLPLSGCADNSHCLYSQMVCERGQCVCREDFHYQDGRCMYIGPPTEPTQVTVTTDEPNATSPMTTDDVTTSSTSLPPTEMPTELGILPIVLIATVPLVVIILVVVLLIIIMWRCRRSLEKRHKEDSLKRRGQIKISAPSPVHSLDQYGHHRGAESASSGFVEDLEHDQLKYGMAGRTFLGSQKTMPSSREDIDEAAFTAEFPAQVPPSPHVHPIPVAVPRLPGYQLEHIALDYRPGAPTDIPDGDFTTDITYTTDEGSFVTTSVPPSSHGSPNVSRRRAPLAGNHSQMTEATYVSMHPVYSQVTPRSQRRAQEESHDWERRSHERDRLHSTGSHDRSRDYRDRLQSNGSYDYREYRDVSHDYRGRSHDRMDHRERSRSAGRENYRVYEHERERYYNRRDQRSPSPGSGQYYRDRGIATGLDNSLVQAISQMGGGVTTPTHSVRSAGGSRGSHRRRRRRYQGQPHHITHHQQHYRYNSDGPSDHELTSASEAEQSYYPSHRMPSHSLPISPMRSDPDEPDYDTLPPPSHIQVKPATPTNRPRVESPEHVPQSRVDQLKVAKLREGHYDYPRCFYNSPPSSQEVSHSPPPTPSQPVSPPTQSTTLSPPAHTKAPTTRYEHLTPLKIGPREGSPLSVRKHPPSPLALHAEGVVTSGEAFQPSQ